MDLLLCAGLASTMKAIYVSHNTRIENLGVNSAKMINRVKTYVKSRDSNDQTFVTQPQLLILKENMINNEVASPEIYSSLSRHSYTELIIGNNIICCVIG